MCSRHADSEVFTLFINAVTYASILSGFALAEHDKKTSMSACRSASCWVAWQTASCFSYLFSILNSIGESPSVFTWFSFKAVGILRTICQLAHFTELWILLNSWEHGGIVNSLQFGPWSKVHLLSARCSTCWWVSCCFHVLQRSWSELCAQPVNQHFLRLADLVEHRRACWVCQSTSIWSLQWHERLPRLRWRLQLSLQQWRLCPTFYLCSASAYRRDSVALSLSDQQLAPSALASFRRLSYGQGLAVILLLSLSPRSCRTHVPASQLNARLARFWVSGVTPSRVPAVVWLHWRHRLPDGPTLRASSVDGTAPPNLRDRHAHACTMFAALSQCLDPVGSRQPSRQDQSVPW